MQNLFFTNGLMLAGLAALAIPIVIHLLLKRKKQRVAFSTIRFFQHQDEQSSRRRKLRNWLLLSIRLLIVALLVLAFARPFAREDQAGAAGLKPHRVVFVLDRSFSMFATGTDGQRWSVAKQRIQSILSELSSQDSVAVIDGTTHASLLSGFATPKATAERWRNLGPTYGGSNLGDGLRQAVRLLADSPPSSTATIYLVSDLQKNACQGLSSCSVPQQIELKTVPVGDLLSPNLAIVDLTCSPREGDRPRVTVANFSDEGSRSTSLETSIDGQRISSEPLTLAAGGVTNRELFIPPQKPGWHQLRTSIREKDALEADNVRYATFWVPDPARVLVAEPQPASRVFEQQTFFLVSALDPTKDTTNSVPGAFNLTLVTPEQIAGELAKTNGWNVVIVPGLKDLPDNFGKALGAFVRSGGGLVLFLGEGMSANRYNAELMDLLPARLGTSESSPDPLSPWRIAFYETNCVAFAAFRLPNSGDLRIPQFSKRFTIEVPEGTARLAYFDDGVPLILSRTFGKGRVILVNSSADTEWNDWPKHKTFVPFLHGIAKFAAQTTEQSVPEDRAAFTAGDDLQIDLGASARLAKITLVSPGGTETHLTTDSQGKLQDPDMTVPGIYSLRDSGGRELRRLAINPPGEESDLDAFRPAEAERQITRNQLNPKQTLAAGLFGTQNHQRELWTALLLAALVLLLAEPFLANRTSA